MVEFPEVRLKAEHELAGKKLSELKGNGVSLLACDYDGTIFDRTNPNLGHKDSMDLAFLADEKGIAFAVISARGATLDYEITRLVPEMCRTKGQKMTLYKSSGNGMDLKKIDFDRSGITNEEVLYDNSMSLEEAMEVAEAYNKLRVSNPDPNAVKFFRKYLDSLQGFISQDFLDLARLFDGKLFAENVKVSVVLPTDPKERLVLVLKLRSELGNNFSVGQTDLPFADITKKMSTDGKQLAAEKIMETLGIEPKNMGCFGDSPEGNDKGLLTFPYSFTNNQGMSKMDINHPPFVLPISGDKIETVHRALKFLTSE